MRKDESSLGSGMYDKYIYRYIKAAAVSDSYKLCLYFITTNRYIVCINSCSYYSIVYYNI